MLTPTLPTLAPANTAGTVASLNSSNQEASASGSSAPTFSQTLSREVAERKQNDQAESGPDAPGKPPASTAPVSSRDMHKAASKADHVDQDSKEQDPQDSVPVATGPVDMLALVNSLQPAVAQTKVASTGSENNEKTVDDIASKIGQAPATKVADALPDGANHIQNPASLAEQPEPGKFEPAQVLHETAFSSVSDKDGVSTARFLETSLKTAEATVKQLASEDSKRAEISPMAHNLNSISLANTAPLVPLAAALYGSDKLTPRVGSANWDQALSQHVVWMAGNNQQTASLTLNPPDLGPLQIVLNVTNDQASASFMAAQPEVRQALEAAMPRLREMMSDAGIQLGQTSVSTNSSTNSSQQQFARQESSGRSGHDAVDDGQPGALNSLTTGMVVQRAGRGLVDTFA